MTDLAPLPDDVRALIAAEADASPRGDRAAVRARVLATVGVTAVAATAGAATASAATAGTAGTAGAATAGVAAKLVIVALTVGAIGGGAALITRHDPAARTHVGTATPAPRTHVGATEQPSPPPTVAILATTAIEPPPPPRPEPVRPRRSDPTPTAPPPDDQATLLHRAWKALDQGDAAAALAAVELDATTHPAGTLTEERDALRIDALLHLARTDEARRRAREFADRFPHSIHRALITRALEEPTP